MTKEVLAECKRLRPNEFKHVTQADVLKVLLILWRNITYLMKQHALIAIKDHFLLRPNVRYMIRSTYHVQKKARYKASMMQARQSAMFAHRRLLRKEQEEAQKNGISDHSNTPS